MENLFVVTVSTVLERSRGSIMSRDLDGYARESQDSQQLYNNTVGVYKIMPESFNGKVELEPVSFAKGMLSYNPLVEQVKGWNLKNSETSFMDVRGTWVVDADARTATSCTRMEDGVPVVREDWLLTKSDQLSPEQLSLLLGCL